MRGGSSAVLSGSADASKNSTPFEDLPPLRHRFLVAPFVSPAPSLHAVSAHPKPPCTQAMTRSRRAYLMCARVFRGMGVHGCKSTYLYVLGRVGVWARLCECVQVCFCIHACTCLYVRACACVCVRVHVSACACARACVRLWLRVYARACVRVWCVWGASARLHRCVRARVRATRARICTCCACSRARNEKGGRTQ